MLTVVDPCLTAVITGSVPAAASFSVYDALASYSSFSSFTYTSSIGSTACGTLTYTASEAPSFGVSSLTTFALVNPGMGF